MYVFVPTPGVFRGVPIVEPLVASRAEIAAGAHKARGGIPLACCTVISVRISLHTLLYSLI
jgi:hypothetical protein